MAKGKRDLLFVCGIPASGKTTYGTEFARQFGFAHYDLEEQHTLHRLSSNPTQFIVDIVSRLENAVVTWGFVPDHQPSISAVQQFKASGFTLVWLDGNRGAALKRFEERARAASRSDEEFYRRMHEYYLQMYRIEHSRIVEVLSPLIIDPLDSQQEFKAPTKLLQEIHDT